MRRKRSYVGGLVAIAAVLCAIPTAAPAGAVKTALKVSPSTIDCGTQVAVTGSHACPPATITNVSSAPARVAAVNVRGDVTEIGAGTNCGAQPLAPGASCTLHTSFNPSATGRAQVRVSVFDQNGGAATARAFGVGIAG
jgi:hypothetical protein